MIRLSPKNKESTHPNVMLGIILHPKPSNSEILEPMKMLAKDADNDGFGKDPFSVQGVTKLFARQNLHEVPPERLKQVDPEDRLGALQDAHGAREPVAETDEFVEEKLNELAGELSRWLSGDAGVSTVADRELPKTHQKAVLEWPDLELRKWLSRDSGSSTSSDRELPKAYQKAVLEWPDFVERQLIKFLRAERFHVKRAAIRCLNYYQKKMELFGPESLGKDLGLGDLNQLDMMALKDGAVQLLCQRDRAGRAILAMFAKVACRYPIQPIAKLVFWSAEIASQDVDVQRRGWIFVHYAVGVPEMEKDARKRSPAVIQLGRCIPLRYCAVHGCTDDPSVKFSYSVAALYVQIRNLFQLQTHFGSHIECRYNLMAMGIPLDVIPIMNDGSIDLTRHLAWLEQLEIEGSENEKAAAWGETSPFASDRWAVANATSMSLVDPPGPKDIVMGRGQRGAKLPGNAMLRKLMKQYAEEYYQGSRLEKTQVSKTIYQKVRRAGCRFLELVESGDETRFSSKKRSKGLETSALDGLWVEVDEISARGRISHRFRNIRPQAAS